MKNPLASIIKLTNDERVQSLPYPYNNILRGRKVTLPIVSKGIFDKIQKTDLLPGLACMVFDIRDQQVYISEECAGKSTAVISIERRSYIRISYEAAGKWVGQYERIEFEHLSDIDPLSFFER